MPAVRKRSTWSNIMISTLGGLLHFGQQRGYGYSAQSPYQTTAHPRRASVPITQFSQSAQTLAKNQDHRCRRCRTHCRRYDQSAAWSASTEIVFFLSFFLYQKWRIMNVSIDFAVVIVFVGYCRSHCDFVRTF